MKRYLPEIPFPPYAFLPGQHPHPRNHPRGHSHGNAESRGGLPESQWTENQAFLHGVDLYNFGYFWEAHEVWEGLWRASSDNPERTHIYKALIQWSAACLHLKMGKSEAFQNVARRALGHWGKARGGARFFMGLDVEVLDREWRRFLDGKPLSPDRRPLLFPAMGSESA